MYSSFWSEFSILFIAAVIGSIAILPYGLRLAKESAKKKPLKLSQNMIVLISILQNAIIFAVVTALGLIASHQTGLSNPVVQILLTGNGFNQTIIMHLFIAIVLGILVGGLLLILDLLYLPHLPKKLLETALKTTQLENFTASFYGGINEELLSRLFGVSVIAWLLSHIWHTSTGLPTTSVFWTAIVIMAVLFAFGHLPALKSLVGEITSVLLARTMLLNIPVALVCGWLFWNYGIVTAMLAHFSADIIYHVFGTYVLRVKFSKK